jgi:hypothetical protein
MNAAVNARFPSHLLKNTRLFVYKNVYIMKALLRADMYFSNSPIDKRAGID